MQLLLEFKLIMQIYGGYKHHPTLKLRMAIQCEVKSYCPPARGGGGQKLARAGASSENSKAEIFEKDNNIFVFA